MATQDVKRAAAAVALGIGFAVAATSSASAFGRGGGSTGEQDSYLRQELHNPGFLDSRPTRFNYSRPWPEQYAEPAAAALQRACVARKARLLTERLGAAVERQRIINRTVGLLMAQDGVDAAEARAMLEATGRARGHQLETVARAVWDERIPFACLPPSDDALWALSQ